MDPERAAFEKLSKEIRTLHEYRDNQMELRELVENKDFDLQEALEQGLEVGELEKELNTLNVQLDRAQQKYEATLSYTIPAIEKLIARASSEEIKAELNKHLVYLTLLSLDGISDGESCLNEPIPEREPARKSAIPKSKIPLAGASQHIPRASKLPAPSQIPRKPFIRQLPQLSSKASNIQMDIEKHKAKRQQAELIKQKGTFGNIKRHEQLIQKPRIIPRAEVRERKAGHQSILEASKVVGAMRRRAAQPMPQSSCKFFLYLFLLHLLTFLQQLDQVLTLERRKLESWEFSMRVTSRRSNFSSRERLERKN